jgi:hypothetical protein
MIGGISIYSETVRFDETGGCPVWVYGTCRVQVLAQRVVFLAEVSCGFPRSLQTRTIILSFYILSSSLFTSCHIIPHYIHAVKAVETVAMCNINEYKTNSQSKKI